MQQQQCQIHCCEFTRIHLKLESQSVKFVCEECIDDQGLTTQLEKLVLLQKVKKQPEELISKTNIDNTVKQILSKLLKATEDDLKITKRQWNDRLQKMKQILDSLINETESYFDQLKKELEEFRKGLVSIVNFVKFEQLIQDDQYSNQEKESSIVNYIKELENEIKGQKKTDIIKLIDTYKDKIKNTQIPNISEKLNFITKEMNDYQGTVKDYSQKCNPEINIKLPTNLTSSKILSQQNLEKLLQRIGNQRKCSIQQIYHAQQLGVNADAFWNNVNNKSNLLMIFRSKNQAIFGGYSPCQWKKLSNQIQQGVFDETYTSFLFSQSGEDFKFFPIKKENKPAIFLNNLSGPIFGNDLSINADFQGGQIKLGNTYAYDNLPGQPQFFFGGLNQPNIYEFEIIQIVY